MIELLDVALLGGVAFLYFIFFINLILIIASLLIRKLLKEDAVNVSEKRDNPKKEVNHMNIDKLRKKLNKNIHHKNEWNKIPAITEYAPGSDKFGVTCLHWCYNDSEITVETRDYNLISLIDDVIKMYLEETENNTNESPDYQPHKFNGSGYYKGG